MMSFMGFSLKKSLFIKRLKILELLRKMFFASTAWVE